MTLSADPDQRSVTGATSRAGAIVHTRCDDVLRKRRKIKEKKKEGNGGACENQERDSTRMEMPRVRHCMEMRASRPTEAASVTNSPIPLSIGPVVMSPVEKAS